MTKPCAIGGIPDALQPHSQPDLVRRYHTSIDVDNLGFYTTIWADGRRAKVQYLINAQAVALGPVPNAHPSA